MGSGPTNKARRKELLNINPVICFQGPGSWRRQWAERLHADLRHRLPPGGSLTPLAFFILFIILSFWTDGQVGRAGWCGLTADRIVGSTERLQNVTSGGLWFDLVTVVVRVSNTEVSMSWGKLSGCSQNNNGALSEVRSVSLNTNWTKWLLEVVQSWTDTAFNIFLFLPLVHLLHKWEWEWVKTHLSNFQFIRSKL